MKKLAYLIGLLLVVAVLSGESVTAQNSRHLSKKEKRQIERLRKEKIKKMQLEASRKYMIELLSKQYFVFQADYFTTPNGTSVSVNSEVNFVYIHKGRTIVQLGLDGATGINGAGGITAKGAATGYQFSPGKKKNNMSVLANLNLTGVPYPFQMTLNVSDDGTGQLVLQFSNGRMLTLYGQVVSPKQASFYVGQSLY